MAAADFKIRPFRRGDRQAAQTLLEEAGYPLSPADCAAVVAWICSHPETEAFLAVDVADHPLGLISLSHRPQMRIGGRIGTVEILYVKPEHRRQGLGKALIEQVLARTQALGCRRVEANVPRAASGGRALLATLGFTLVDEDVMKR